MANSFVLLSGSNNRLSWRFTLDGTAGPMTITQADIVSATLGLAALKTAPTATPPVTLLTNVPTPPITSILTAVYTDQAAVRAATIDGPCKANIRVRSAAAPADAAHAIPFQVDVDKDAVATTKMKITVNFPSAVGVFDLDMIAAFSTSDGPNIIP